MRLSLVRSVLLGSILAPGAALCSGEHFAFATLEDDTYVGFALIRTGTEKPTGSIGEVAFPRTNSVSRVLVDEDGNTYFGYRLEVKSAKSSKFEVGVKPLTADLKKELRRLIPCPDCPLPRLLAPLPRYPAPRVISDGDVFTLDLLVNPDTNERIIDVVKISKSPIDVATMKTASSKVTRALKAVRIAETHMLGGRYSLAVKEFKKALAIHPNNAVIHNKLGICYQRSQDINNAEREFKEALRINPSYAAVWNNLGALEHGRGRYKQAIKHYQKAISLKHDFATVHKNMGTAYFALQRFEEGYEAYQTAYRFDPTILEASATMPVDGTRESVSMECFFIAKICAANGQVEAALIFLRKAMDAGFKDFKRIKRDADFKAVVADPRYKKLVEEFK
jgi:tetratricopeptide (TPR) repeat protein